jgi:hypothetical protein
MWQWIKSLDRILRGEATRLPMLREGKLDVPVVGLSLIIAMLGILYGLCMGLFAVTPGGSGHAMQLPATMLKVPALFLLTLLVTFPSLYVFNALVGSRLFILNVLRLLIASLAMMLAVLSSIGPIVAFFSFTSTSYPFMILLNVTVYAISGLLGLAFLLQTLHRMTIAEGATLETRSRRQKSVPQDLAEAVAIAQAAHAENPDSVPERSPLDLSADHVLAPHGRTAFRIWVVVFGLVGSQMAWVLRPFIGNPDQPFSWFRHPDSNFFQAVFHNAVKLFS